MSLDSYIHRTPSLSSSIRRQGTCFFPPPAINSALFLGWKRMSFNGNSSPIHQRASRTLMQYGQVVKWNNSWPLSRFLELLINSLSHEEPVASQHCGQLRGFIPICDVTGNALTLLSVYQSSTIDCFHENIRWQKDGNDVRFGSVAASHHRITWLAAIQCKADIRQDFLAFEIWTAAIAMK